MFLAISSYSQERYWVFFNNKQGSTFEPYSYFDQKAIDRRIKNNISLFDSTDFPVNQTYINKVTNIVDSVNIVTRWFNGVSVIATNQQISEVANLKCVNEIQQIMSFATISEYSEDSTISYYDSSLLANEMNALDAQSFIDNNIDGSGIRIAIFDAGFPGVDTLSAFEHIRKDNRILKTYDFQKKKEFVYGFNHHGTNVFSCIAGKIGNTKLGLATGAEFLLARTEITREIFVEEENWLAAAEWADKNGADIINSSLGYTVPRYFQKEMDGKSTLVSQAAKMASDKGILVVNAMGNDGDGNWKVVGAPADVEEVLSIGGVDPYDNIHINFSSFGPTADGRMKPNVCAAGEALVASPKGGVTSAYGTSFSSPLIAGFAACALQTDTTLTNMELKEKIEHSGNLYPYFDYAHGFGIPQASYFFDNDFQEKVATFTVDKYSDSLIVNFSFNPDTLSSEGNYFFYHFRYKNEPISKYVVVDMQTNSLTIDLTNFPIKPIIFMGHFKGYTKEIIIKN